MSDAMTPCDPNDPMLIAFNQWKEAERYPICRQWALNPQHVDGSLWEAFTAGYNSTRESRDAWERRAKGMMLGNENFERENLALRDLISEAQRLLAGSDGAGGWHEARRVLAKVSEISQVSDRKPHEGETLPPLIERALNDALSLPEWFPNCPWPTSVWLSTVEEAGKKMREFLKDETTTAISGTLMRHGWQVAALEIAKAWRFLYEGGVWWCNSHQRQAAGPNGCDGRLGGILSPCRAVFAPIEIEPTIKYYPDAEMIAKIEAVLADWEHEAATYSQPMPGYPVTESTMKSMAAMVSEMASAIRSAIGRSQESETVDPEHVGEVQHDGWRDIADPQMRLKAGDMAREANDDTWIDIHPSWVDTRIGDHQRVHFRRHAQMGLTDTEIVSRLSRHFVTVTHKHDPVGHRETMYYIQRGTLKERAIEIPTE